MSKPTLPDVTPEDHLEEIVSAASEPAAKLFEVRYCNDPDASPLEKPEELVEGFLSPGYSCASGPPKKAKKTLFWLALALHLHTGKEFLGREVKRSACAWLQLDMPDWGFRDYSDRIAEGMDVPPEPMPYFANGLIDLADPAQWSVLCEKLRALGTQVLFVDSARACASVEENQADSVKLVTRKLFCYRLRDALRMSVVLICHTPKGSTGAAGSVEWEGAADSVFSFQPRNNDVQIDVRGRHANRALRFRLNSADDAGGPLSVAEVLGSPTAHTMNLFSQAQFEEAHQLVHEAAEEGINRKQLFEALKGLNLGVGKSRQAPFVEEFKRKYGNVVERLIKDGKSRSKCLFFGKFGPHAEQSPGLEESDTDRNP